MSSPLGLIAFSYTLGITMTGTSAWPRITRIELAHSRRPSRTYDRSHLNCRYLKRTPGTQSISNSRRRTTAPPILALSLVRCRWAELLEHHLDVATGLCEVLFEAGDAFPRLQIFVDTVEDGVWQRMVDDDGQPTSAPFERIRLLPDPDTPEALPAYRCRGPI